SGKTGWAASGYNILFRLHRGAADRDTSPDAPITPQAPARGSVDEWIGRRMWPDAETTQELVGQARQGNADAAGRLLDRHRESLRRLVEMRLDRRIRRRVDASDVVQEVLVEANRRLARYLENPVLPFHLWL